MWYIILGLVLVIYLLLNSVIPGAGAVGSYILQPLLWIALAVATFLIAQNEGLNILKFKKTIRWYIGNSPVHAGIFIGAFQVAILIIVGIFAGFGKSPYSFTPTSILINIVFVGSLLLGTEISRAYLIKKGTKPRKYMTLTMILVTLLFMFIRISPNDFTVLTFSNPPAALEFMGTMLIMALSINLLASYLSYLGGATASIGYMGTLLAFEWFSPILPNPHWTVSTLVGTIAPAIGFIIIQSSLQFPQDKKRVRREKRKTGSSGWTVTAIFCVIIIFFSFGYLGVSPTVIYSGSMRPALDVGDIVLIDKVDIEEIQENDIIQYVSYDNVTLVIHRLVKVYEEEGKTYFITKGDANDDPDSKPITENRILGKSIFTIPKLGWIQIFIKSIFKNIGIPV